MPGWYDHPRDWGHVHNFTLGHLLLSMNAHADDPAGHAKFTCDADGWVMGFPLPPFQRDVCWEEWRMIRFIETLADKGDPGTYTYHQNDVIEMIDGAEKLPRDRWLIDGLQRLTSIEAFVNDGFPVYGLRWSEIDATRKRGFMNQSFPAFVVRNKSELELRELFDLKNFGGVALTEEQRALPRP